MHLSERLEGRYLEDGWKVVEKVPVVAEMTGSNFSIGYSAEQNGGRKGFVKVLDQMTTLRRSFSGCAELIEVPFRVVRSISTVN